MNKFQHELQSFQDLWKGGYFVGDPLDPMGPSDYGELGYLSMLHAVYLFCIKPYVNENTRVIEIGPGRGAWTKTFLKAKEIHCLDALSAEHNGFWEYLGYPENVKYFQVSNFSCKELQNDYYDFLFSFGCFCHISFEGITEYMKNLFPKLRLGASCFIMIADYDQYNKIIDNLPKYSVERVFQIKRYIFNMLLMKLMHSYKRFRRVNKDEGDLVKPGRWYHAGVDRTCQMLENLGYEIISKDIGVCFRDPIVHFRKG
jgi:phospholipid N-methyltransferase